MGTEEFSKLSPDEKINALYAMIFQLREAAKLSQRRILTDGEVFPADKANQLVEDAWRSLSPNREIPPVTLDRDGISVAARRQQLLDEYETETLLGGADGG